jgi:hypothetical protein
MHRGAGLGWTGEAIPPPGVRVGGGGYWRSPTLTVFSIHTYHFFFPHLPKNFLAGVQRPDQADLIQRCIGRIFFPFFFFIGGKILLPYIYIETI